MHVALVEVPMGTQDLALQEADTDDHQGTLGFEEFCAFYKMMSTRRDLYLLMLTYSNHKDHLDAASLQRFLQVEQKVRCLGSCWGASHQALPSVLSFELHSQGTVVMGELPEAIPGHPWATWAHAPALRWRD